MTLVFLLSLLSRTNTSDEISDAGASRETIDAPYIRYRISNYWHGWHSVDRMITFGDSWSMTGFNATGNPPSLDNPLGNPAWPGKTSTNGANWIDYATYTYNESLILTANFAVGGATVDEDLIPPPMPHDFNKRGGLKYQIKEFSSLLADSSRFEWHADSSLFVIWIGINDIHEAELNPQFRTLFPNIMEVYAAQVDLLYHLGARNFLFITVPPIEKAPIAVGKDDYIQNAVALFNQNVTQIADNFTATYSTLR